MSQEDGHLPISGTKIEDFEYTKQNVIAFALHSLLYTKPSAVANLPYNRLGIFAVILVGVVVIQLFRFLHMVGIHMHRFHSVILQEFPQGEPVVTCRPHAGDYSSFAVFLRHILHPCFECLESSLCFVTVF